MSSFMTAALLIGIGLAAIIYLSIDSKVRFQNKLRLSWSNHKRFFGNPYYQVDYNYYFQHLVDNHTDHFFVDDITWNDLNLSLVMDNMNYTFTSAGDEALYASLRNIISQLPDEQLMARIENDSSYREKLAHILATLGKSYNSDSSKYFMASYLFPKYEPKYLLLTFAPMLGILLMFYNVIAGIILFLLFNSINSYFSNMNKRKVENEYTDFFYAISIVNTARKIHRLNDEAIDTKGLTSLRVLSPFLITEDSSKENWLFNIINTFKSMFFVDYHLYYYLLRSFKKNADAYSSYWHFVARHDVSYSTALWRRTLPYYSSPVPVTGEELTAEELYHPLVENAVPNDIQIERDILLTGSNASGKSTFLKTLAVNIILANSLNITTSKVFRYKPGILLSSMNLADSITKGDSYFVSEVKALKRMVDAAEHYDKVYCFFDELFKGTNTIDRISSGESILHYFSKHNNVTVMAATHDRELTTLLKDRYDFYYFKESILEDHDITFDYKIRRGVSNTSNAIELLNIYQFPDIVYDRALHNRTRLYRK
ncbi:MutS-related protein [Macrococcus lamae]|uniref:DNA mismatch repair proteins mutS family domain-containing protein n=1 Tax=Macrococcus lamae TaxID=198484 RepID=A0A4V3BEQ7_9STAP|nr:hypothetical protein [Macrococcus lamae]TDM05279.1 hypothetical protein ERX29_10240 [Macrococcus lamae]